jgi:hypothetical protein
VKCLISLIVQHDSAIDRGKICKFPEQLEDDRKNQKEGWSLDIKEATRNEEVNHVGGNVIEDYSPAHSRSAVQL